MEWQVVLWGQSLVLIGLTDFPKPEWAIAHPTHPSHTPLDLINLFLHRLMTTFTIHM